MRRGPILIALGVIVLVTVLSSVFIVDEREKALVLRFGQVERVIEEPGISIRIPIVQTVVKYDDRIQSLDAEPTRVIPADERRLVVDGFSRWRIADVVAFRQAVAGGGLPAAERRLERILDEQLRAELGKVTSSEILSSDRVLLMNRIRDSARIEARSLGIDVIDVRIKRADLPEQNLEFTFNRMNAEREREAEDERARGREQALRVTSQADREAVEEVSDAQRKAEIIRGEADAERIKIYAEAFGRDPEFFAFYRSLKAYERSLLGSNSTLVISPDSEFFEYLKTDNFEGSPRR